MSQHHQLGQLAARKAVLQCDIADHRVRCAAAAGVIVQPLEWLDRMLAFWGQISPEGKVLNEPPSKIAQRTPFPLLKTLRSLLCWGPLVLSIVQKVRDLADNRAAAARL